MQGLICLAEANISIGTCFGFRQRELARGSYYCLPPNHLDTLWLTEFPMQLGLSTAVYVCGMRKKPLCDWGCQPPWHAPWNVLGSMPQFWTHIFLNVRKFMYRTREKSGQKIFNLYCIEFATHSTTRKVTLRLYTCITKFCNIWYKCHKILQRSYTNEAIWVHTTMFLEISHSKHREKWFFSPTSWILHHLSKKTSQNLLHSWENVAT